MDEETANLIQDLTDRVSVLEHNLGQLHDYIYWVWANDESIKDEQPPRFL